MKSIFALVCLCLAVSTTHGLRRPGSFVVMARQDQHEKPNVMAALDEPPTYTTKALDVRGGFVVGLVRGILRTVASLLLVLLKNPILVLLMAGSIFIDQFGEQYKVPYPKMLQNALGMAIGFYVFYLLTQWQKSVNEKSG